MVYPILPERDAIKNFLTDMQNRLREWEDEKTIHFGCDPRNGDWGAQVGSLNCFGPALYYPVSVSVTLGRGDNVAWMSRRVIGLLREESLRIAPILRRNF